MGTVYLSALAAREVWAGVPPTRSIVAGLTSTGVVPGEMGQRLRQFLAASRCC